MRVALLVAVAVACGATSALASGPVRLVAAPSTAQAGAPWTLRLVASRSGRVVVEARAGTGRRISARAREVAPRRYRATLRFPEAGSWRVRALFRGKRFPLAMVRVTPARYALDQPAQLLQARDGSLLVTERGRRDHILAVDPKTGAFRIFATRLSDPWGVAYAPDGSLLVSSDAGMYRVPAAGGAATRILNVAVSPFVPLPNGDLLAAHLTWIGRLPFGATEPEKFPIDVNAPHGMALAPDGSLLVTDTGNRRVIRVDVARQRAVVVTEGDWTPLGLALEPAGSMLVLDFDRGTLLRVAPDGRRSMVAKGLRRPYALSRIVDGTTYVVEAGELSHPSGSLARISAAGVVTRIRLHRSA